MERGPPIYRVYIRFTPLAFTLIFERERGKTFAHHLHTYFTTNLVILWQLTAVLTLLSGVSPSTLDPL